MTRAARLSALVLLAGVVAASGATEVDAAQSLERGAAARREAPASRQMFANGAFMVLNSVQTHSSPIGELPLPPPTLCKTRSETASL